MLRYDFVLYGNLIALIVCVFSIGIMFIHRSSGAIGNRRRSAAGATYQAFLDLLARTGVISICVLAYDAFWGLASNSFALNASYWLTLVYVGLVGLSLLLFVSIGDFFSKVLLWVHSSSRK